MSNVPTVNPSAKTLRNRRRRQRRNAKRRAMRAQIQNGGSGGRVPSSSRRNRGGRVQQVAVPIPAIADEAADLDSGAATFPTNISTMPELRSWRSGKIDLSPDDLSWFFKYLDPAGATESGRAMGEFSKIPDGLVKFSVDAEMRIVNNEVCPVVSTSEIPLDGSLWSLSVLSFPNFRLGYIAIANVMNADVTNDVVYSLLIILNNLTGWRGIVTSDDWIAFGPEEAGWFFKLRVFPPTFDLPDPEEGLLRTVTDYRLTYKSLTLEANMPTLIDQGWWVGGHYALTPAVTEQRLGDGPGQTKYLQVSINPLIAQVVWDGIPQGGVGSGTPVPTQAPPSGNPTGMFAWTFGGAGNINCTITYRVPNLGNPGIPGVIVDASTGTVIANSGEDIVLTFVSSGNLVPLVVTIAGPTNSISFSFPRTPQATVGSRNFYNSAQEDGSVPSNRINMPLPPMTTDQVVANNPKMEQYLLKDGLGAYIVHSKMRNPVFQLTPASSFGGLSFTYPGYDMSNNAEGRIGIRDSVDANMSTAVVHIKGMSRSTSIVIKGYQGWEGVTATNTPFGQFAHSGLPKNDEILTLADDLAGVRLTGVYHANDNFAAAVASFGASMLSSVLKSEATNSIIQNLGQQATVAAQTGISKLPGLLLSLPGKIAGRIRARRARRAARRQAS